MEKTLDSVQGQFLGQPKEMDDFNKRLLDRIKSSGLSPRPRWYFLVYNFFDLSLSEFPTTETLEAPIAKPAKTGLSNQPKRGKNAPPANGMPIML